MAHFRKNCDNYTNTQFVHIRSAEQTEHFTVYTITVTIGSYSWTVKHRYSEFYDLHEKLTASHKIDKNLLPGKKLFGNQTESFIKKRQQELEIYLQTIIVSLAKHIPLCLSYFLDFDKYEIHGITQTMAEDLYSRGEVLLQSQDRYEVSSLQLYSLTERLKLPEPTCDSGDVKKDLGHILDFITRTKHLKITCSQTPVGASNIVMNKLPFDLTLFKSLKSLEITGCNLRLVNGLDTVKQTVVKFGVHEAASSMKEIFLQDAPHWRAEDGSVIVDSWKHVTDLDLSRNSFSEIHESIQMMPNVEKLNLNHNSIETIQNLQWLSHLIHLDLSHNNIRHVDSLHTKMGNIKCVKLLHNQLESLHGFAKLFSLKTLDVSYNKITDIEELKYVSHLPCMEELSLVGNPVVSSLDYRTKTLQMFGDRVAEVILDNQRPNQKELDTVAVLHALRKAKDVKMAKKIQPKKNASFVSLSDVYSQSPSGSLSDHPEGTSSCTISPAHGATLSGSVSGSSSLADWHRKDSATNQHNRSSSPFSQDSLSCSSVLEGEDETVAVPEICSYDTIVQPIVGHILSYAADSQRTLQSSVISSNGVNFESTDSEHEVTDLPEQVPEAHPFDPYLENPHPSSSSRLGVSLTNPSRYINNGQVSQFFAVIPVESQSPYLGVTNINVTSCQISEQVASSLPVSAMRSESHTFQHDQFITQDISKFPAASCNLTSCINKR